MFRPLGLVELRSIPLVVVSDNLAVQLVNQQRVVSQRGMEVETLRALDCDTDTPRKPWSDHDCPIERDGEVRLGDTFRVGTGAVGIVSGCS